QAVPGPLFTFASYLGTMIEGLSGAVIATIAIFLPSFFLIIAALPFLSEFRQRRSFQGVLVGVNACVGGILFGAFYYPVIKSSFISSSYFALEMLLFSVLNKCILSDLSIVIIGVSFGYVLNLLGF